MAPWDIAFETLLYSSINGPDSSTTIFIKTPKFDSLSNALLNKYNILLGVHFSPLWYTSNDMPPQYFRLPSSGYKYLTHSQDDSSFHEEIYSAQNIKIEPLQQAIHLHLNNWEASSIPVEIINTSGHIIPAIPRTQNPVMGSIKFFDEHGKSIFRDTASILETDISSKSICGIAVFLPRVKGTYYVKPGIITRGVRDWNIPIQPIKIIVD